MSNYPAGVTGNEPQIIGTGTEDKCQRCLEMSDGETALKYIADGEFEVDGEFLCAECKKEKDDE